MNHGGGGGNMHSATPPQSGPRAPNVEMGFAATKHTGNILRLLESSHGTYFYNTYDALSTVWHANSQSWRSDKNSSSSSSWSCVNPIEALSATETIAVTHSHHHPSSPKLCSTSFSDDRTALVKMVGQDGKVRYLQLLRLDGDVGNNMAAAAGMTPNDGWILTQEVVAEQEDGEPISSTALSNLQWALLKYLDVEHGGGKESYQMAKRLFHPDSKLMSVGIDDVEAAPTQWTAPVGSLVVVPLEVYLDGVQSQLPHARVAKSRDRIVKIDHITGTNAAAATVRVGNGAQTLVFEDLLLLGMAADGEWQILSKTFSSQAWK